MPVLLLCIVAVFYANCNDSEQLCKLNGLEKQMAPDGYLRDRKNGVVIYVWGSYISSVGWWLLYFNTLILFISVLIQL